MDGKGLVSVRSAQLRQKATIQQDTGNTRNSAGEHVANWTTFATCRAQKVHQTSREFFAAQKVNAEMTDLFIIRYRSGVDAKMRLVFDEKTYDIIGAPDPDGRRRELHVLCKVVE